MRIIEADPPTPGGGTPVLATIFSERCCGGSLRNLMFLILR